MQEWTALLLETTKKAKVGGGGSQTWLASKKKYAQLFETDFAKWSSQMEIVEGKCLSFLPV